MEPKEFLLFVGTAHDPELRRQVAERARAAGFEVKDENGPFGTVVVVSTAPDDHLRFVQIDGVESFCPVGTAEDEAQFADSLDQMLAARGIPVLSIE